MKNLLLYLLLFSYTSVMFKPVMPYVSDIIAHAFWYSHHMATVHYENGKYHVHNEVSKEAKNNNQENPNTDRKDAPANEHLAVVTKYDYSTYKIITRPAYPIQSPTLLYGHLMPNYLPPNI